MQKANFDKAFERTVIHEGGYVNNPQDPGGETNWGITKRTALAAGYTGSMRDLSRDAARDIYHTAYWQRAQCDKLPFALAFQLFDAAVNHGIGNAIRFLQRTVGVIDDGVVGQVTLAAVSRMPLAQLLARYQSVRLDFYTRLTTFDAFGRGWTRRMAQNLDYAAHDLKAEAAK